MTSSKWLQDNLLKPKRINIIIIRSYKYIINKSFFVWDIQKPIKIKKFNRKFKSWFKYNYMVYR